MYYTQEQITVFANKLQQLPEVTKNKLSTKKEAIGKLKAEIQILKKKGYTLENIAESMRGVGLEISTQTLKTYLQCTKSKLPIKKKTNSQANLAPPPPPPAAKLTKKGTATNTAGFEVKEDTIDI